MDGIQLRMNYDEVGDVLYINFGTEEPTYCEEIEEDFIFLEIGWFSKQVKGIRVISPKANGLGKFCQI